MSPGGAAVGADLGGSSKYSNENFEGRRGERFHVNDTCTWLSRRYGPAAGRAPHVTWCPMRPGRPLKIRRTECHPRPVVLITASGLALRAGHGGPSPEPISCRCTARAAPAARAGRRVPVGGRPGNGTFGGLPRATNSRLRTGTDKGNPTV
ncbi:hypothetical protein V6N13_040395 [Hibiscus sabdariffa]